MVNISPQVKAQVEAQEKATVTGRSHPLPNIKDKRRVTFIIGADVPMATSANLSTTPLAGSSRRGDVPMEKIVSIPI